MRERPGIFRELRGTQPPYILDPLDRGRALVGGEALVAKDGEALFQRELEPVAAGDAVARPVMEILMRYHRRDRVEVIVGRGVGIGEDIARIEDVEALVLHRPEVEIVDRDDVEHVEIIFAAIDALVPCHRDLERLERVAGLGDIGGAHPDAERDLAA